MKKKNLGFTLAEVLIVIGIIGVVAALTLPNLNHATGDKEKVTKVKKIYAALSDAVDRAQAIYGPFDTWFKDLGEEDYNLKSERYGKRVTEFLKVSKDCGFEAGCFSTAPLLNIDSDAWEENMLEWLAHDYMVTLSDGVSLAFEGWSTYNRITVDIDGPNKGKNMFGSDIFGFIFPTDFNLVSDFNLIPDHNMWGDLDFASGSSGNVTYWVIQNGNLDYLKCPDELDWETKTSCE